MSNKKKSVIYLVTVITKLPQSHRRDREWIRHRAIGYFLKPEDAHRVARTNNIDIHELEYDWLIIEKIPPGTYAQAEVVQWYRWQGGRFKGKYLKSKPPRWAHRICNFGMG